MHLSNECVDILSLVSLDHLTVDKERKSEKGEDKKPPVIKPLATGFSLFQFWRVFYVSINYMAGPLVAL